MTEKLILFQKKGRHFYLLLLVGLGLSGIWALFWFSGTSAVKNAMRLQSNTPLDLSQENYLELYGSHQNLIDRTVFFLHYLQQPLSSQPWMLPYILEYHTKIQQEKKHLLDAFFLDVSNQVGLSEKQWIPILQIRYSQELFEKAYQLVMENQKYFQGIQVLKESYKNLLYPNGKELLHRYHMDFSSEESIVKKNLEKQFHRFHQSNIAESSF